MRHQGCSNFESVLIRWAPLPEIDGFSFSGNLLPGPTTPVLWKLLQLLLKQQSCRVYGLLYNRKVFDTFLFMHKTEPTECPGVSSSSSSSGVSSGAAAAIAIVMFIVGMICTMVLVLVVRFCRTRRRGFNLLHSKYRKQENEMEGFAD